MKKLKFPKLANTLIAKIRKENPWQLGNELAFIVSLNWDKMKASQDLKEFSNYFEAFGCKHYLDPYHVACSIQEYM